MTSQTAASRLGQTNPATGLFYLRLALIAVGLLAFLLYPLTVVWPSGWAWGHGHSHYLMMIVGIYATLGVFLLIASRDPMRHKGIIWFTVWSSVVHGGIMAAQSFNDPAERSHLVGDVPALFLIAIVLAALMRRTEQISRGLPALNVAMRRPQSDPKAALSGMGSRENSNSR